MNETTGQMGGAQDAGRLERLLRAEGTSPDDARTAGLLLEQVQRRMGAQEQGALARLRALPAPLRAALWLGATALLLGGVLIATPRAELAQYPTTRMAWVLLALAALLAPSLAGALRPWHRPAPRGATVSGWVIAAVGATCVAALLPQAHVLLPHTAPAAGQSLLQHTLPCLIFGGLCAAPVFLLARLLGRGVPHATVMAAAAAGLVGNLALQLHCPITEQAHLLVGHALVSMLAVAGALSAHAIGTWRARA